jgi:glycosyltransferase involved in cell wall biosynthesis
VTTILEAMSMAKPVIVTHIAGQTDVIEDRRAITRGAHPRERPTSLLRRVSETAGVDIEPNGFYVPRSVPGALRRAIEYLLVHPAERANLGAAGRRTVERLAGLEQYVERLRVLVDQSIAASPVRSAQVSPRHSEPSLRGVKSR